MPAHAVVTYEAEYLTSQYYELPVIEAAMAAHEEARTHNCGQPVVCCDHESHRAAAAAAAAAAAGTAG